MEYKKDYSLLRPFDLEAAKRGELLCWRDGDGPLEYVGEYVAKNDEWIFRWIGGDVAGKLGHFHAGQLRLAPLAWVEGKPVYKGDVLYHSGFKAIATPAGFEFEADKSVRTWDGLKPSYWTWTPPKVKRKVKLLAYLFNNEIRWYSETTKLSYHDGRIPSEDKVVEVED